MFSSLKEKLKGWAQKIKKEVLTEEKPIKKASKKEKINKKKEKTSKTPKKEKTEKKDKPEIIEEPEKEERKSFFGSIFKKELSTEKFEELFQELELNLLQNNVAYEVVEKIKSSLSEKLVGKKDYHIESELTRIISDILIEPPNFIKEIKDSLKEKRPYVISLVGINGSGKTTTIAKLANYLKKQKLTVCLAAADTYRAASIEQLETHANKLGVPIIKKDYGIDPASVGFEAIQYAKKNKIDVVLIDTAGRLNNKESLMKELEKIIRVSNPDMKIFVGESTTGNDATEQAKTFNELIGLTGIILSKADVDEKGGTMISVGYVTKKPIIFLGTGQEYKDLEEFDKTKLLKNLGL